jgi:hypothetical protein
MFDESVIHGDLIYRDDDQLSSVRFKIRLPWYRSLTASCIEGIDITIGGAEVSRKDVALTLYGLTHSLDEVAGLSDVLWFVRDAVDVHVRTPTPLKPGPQDVKVVMRVRIPYGPDFNEIAICQKRLTLVGSDY